MRIRLGTRGSRLARAQSARVADRLRGAGHTVETVVVETRGDQRQAEAFAAIGQAGIFVRELERALAEGRVDLVVHSYKDLPSESPAGLVVAAVPERLDPADRLLARPDAVDPASGGLLPLVAGARVGTASARRQALVRHLRPDLELGLLRGNVPTRLDKLRRGEHDAIVLAAAGLDRLERSGGLDRSDLAEIRLDPAIFVPAPAQGALALQVREPGASAGDLGIHEVVAALNDPAQERTVQAERELLARVDGGCHTPFGAWCHAGIGQVLHLEAVLGVPGGELRRASGTGRDPVALAAELASRLVPVPAIEARS